MTKNAPITQDEWRVLYCLRLALSGDERGHSALRDTLRASPGGAAGQVIYWSLSRIERTLGAKGFAQLASPAPSLVPSDAEKRLLGVIRMLADRHWPRAQWRAMTLVGRADAEPLCRALAPLAGLLVARGKTDERQKDQRQKDQGQKDQGQKDQGMPADWRRATSSA